MAEVNYTYVPWEQLQARTIAVFRAAGSDLREAQLIAEHLVEANLRGHDSHGVGVVPMYLGSQRAKGLVLNQELRVAIDTGAMLICDAGLGAGQVMAHDAMVLGIERARDEGSAIVSLRNSHHIGRIGHWAEQCAAAGMVSIHFVNVVAGAIVAPFGGTQARLGTNPFAAAFPRAGQPPVVVDFATSTLASGKVRVAHNKGVPIPAGALLDNQGKPTTDPGKLFETPPGALTTFGEHKGWGLMLACELLGAALVGAPTQHVGPGTGTVINSMFSVIVSPERLGTAGLFAGELEAVLGWVTSEDGVRLPGQPELDSRSVRIANGIPVDPATLDQLEAAARDVGMNGFLAA
ncbi:MAG: malate/lactate/ureidoglycolate dehydrogenase [Devosia sp.]|uniref:malate/lactate/ureidoglycolate dehydrogenase n=1 Tax=Devosia sp. TaxID=1871048 RepID=UPI001AC33D38|nr:malate/lactate/ureidoglycolate dehydrogenase [Devosia sp.]MBN9317474.1 malate/lactate/ureidoglycolate dehydrogenase [Devosia sp.]